MKANWRRLPTRFAPETRFDLRPLGRASARVAREEELEGLKRRLLAEKLEEFWNTPHNGRLWRAANEAAAVAWVTPYPLLVFPELFEEKAKEVLAYAEQQERVTRMSRELLAV